jgi:hypothetical protein
MGLIDIIRKENYHNRKIIGIYLPSTSLPLITCAIVANSDIITGIAAIYTGIAVTISHYYRRAEKSKNG